jgi:hypothetical protein
MKQDEAIEKPIPENTGKCLGVWLGFHRRREMEIANRER